MRRGVELLREQNVLIFDGFLKIALAEAEARAGDVDRAVSVLDESAGDGRPDWPSRTALRRAELHRRPAATMLLKRDPANPAAARGSACKLPLRSRKAREQRSFELRAALALAKLYQSTGRDAEAHAVLAPALEGFSATTAMPEIAEAQALLVALA